MRKNKMTIILIIVIVLIIAIVLGAMIFNNGNKDNKDNKDNKEVNQINNEEETGISRIDAIYKKMLETKNYSFSVELNEENYRKTSKNGESVKIEINDEGNKETYIVKGENTYLLVDSSKEYYKYENTVSLLNSLENNFKDFLQRKYKVGKEKVENKEYRYEEFDNMSSFLINFKKSVDQNNTKTRFYFEGNNLKYIKTYVGEIEQLLKVDLEFNNQNDSYKIPQSYKK